MRVLAGRLALPVAAPGQGTTRQPGRRLQELVREITYIWCFVGLARGAVAL